MKFFSSDWFGGNMDKGIEFELDFHSNIDLTPGKDCCKSGKCVALKTTGAFEFDSDTVSRKEPAIFLILI